MATVWAAKEKHKTVLAKLIKQLIVIELIDYFNRVSGIKRNNTCGFAIVAPPVDMPEDEGWQKMLVEILNEEVDGDSAATYSSSRIGGAATGFKAYNR
ncbi:hypothetical protein ACLOJK_005371 [Asimina triloba]